MGGGGLIVNSERFLSILILSIVLSIPLLTSYEPYQTHRDLL
jgi:hypothetical protein